VDSKTIDELKVVIVAETSKLQEDLAKATNMISKFDKTASKSGGTALEMAKGFAGAQIALGAISAIVRGVTNSVKQNVGAVIDAAKVYDRLRISTNTVAKNMGIARSEVDDLRASLAESNTFGITAENVIKSLTLSGLLQMSKALEGVDARTGKTVKGVNALVLTMKDLGAIAGADSATAIEKITKFIQTGNASFVEGMIELGNLGTEYRAFSKTLGKTRGDLTALEEAQARLNIVQREGQKAFGAYAETYTTSGKAFDSIKSAQEAIRVAIGTGIEPILAAAANSFLRFFQGIRDWATANSNAIRAWATNVAAYIIAVTRAIGSLLMRLPGVGKYFKSMAEFSIKGANAQGELAKQATGASGGLDKATGSAKALNKELKGLAGFDELNVLQGSDTDSSGGAGGLGDIGGAGMDIEPFPDVMPDVEAIASKVNEITDKVAGFMKKVSEGASKMLTPFVNAYNAIVRPAIENLIYYINEVWNIITGGSKGAKVDFEKVATVIANVLGVAIAAVINIITILVLAIGGVVIVLRHWYNNQLNTFNLIRQGFALITTTVSNFAKTLGSGITNALNNIRNGFSNAFAVARNVATGAIDAIVARVSSIRSVFTTLGETIRNSLRLPLNTLIDGVNRFFTALNRVKIPDFVPGVGGKGFSMPTIPKLAMGGVIDSATLAVVGESGREAVMPLERNTGWITELADKINQRGGGGEPINLTVKIGTETIARELIDTMNTEAMKTNGLTFNI
jgi:hypothetical protein